MKRFMIKITALLLLAGLHSPMVRAAQMLVPGGQVLLDSSDIKYIFMNDDGSMDINLAAGYYGEIDYKMRYKGVTGEPFDWLYIDFETLKMYAEEHGFQRHSTHLGCGGVIGINLHTDSSFSLTQLFRR